MPDLNSGCYPHQPPDSTEDRESRHGVPVPSCQFGGQNCFRTGILRRFRAAPTVVPVESTILFAWSQCSTARHQRRRHAEPLDAIQDRCEQLMRHRDFGHLKGHVLGVPHHVGPDLDQLLPQRGQRPVLHGPRQCQPPQEVPEIVRQGEELKPRLVVFEVPARWIVLRRRLLPQRPPKYILRNTRSLQAENASHRGAA